MDYQKNQEEELEPKGFFGKLKKFWSEHTKAIVFAICMIVILGTIGPFGIIAIKRNLADADKAKPAITEANILRMLMQDEITLKEVKEYSGTAKTKDISMTDGSTIKAYIYEMDFDHYHITAQSIESDKGKLNKFNLADLNTSEVIDMLAEGRSATSDFFNEHEVVTTKQKRGTTATETTSEPESINP